jgi:hypothetical protein
MSDDTEDILQKLLSELYGQAARDNSQSTLNSGSYLIAADKQFLGEITDNKFSQNSILNEFGPYGSAFSSTSIFNEYCPYGGDYGQFSPKNPYNTQPPSLFINGKFLGVVSANEYVQNRIPYTAFIYTLKNDLRSLLNGQVLTDEIDLRTKLGDSFIQAADGTFLGSLNPNPFDTSSIFNKFGPHGSKFNQLSIFNKFGNYGGKFSPLSPFNTYSNHPPVIMHGGKQIAHLTVNQRFKPRIDPEGILEWAKAHVRRRIA